MVLRAPCCWETCGAQARLYGAVLEAGIVDALLRDKNGMFSAKTGAATLVARTVILATGVIENKPPVAHVCRRRKARTHPGPVRFCDGYESIGKHIAVLGDGEHAAAEALFLRTYTDRLSLLLMATETAPLSQDTRRALQAAGIGVAHVVIGSVSMGNDGVTVLSVEDGKTHRFDAIYSAFGTTSQTMLATGLGARMDSSNRLFVDAHQATSVDGLYAAGGSRARSQSNQCRRGRGGDRRYRSPQPLAEGLCLMLACEGTFARLPGWHGRGRLPMVRKSPVRE